MGRSYEFKCQNCGYEAIVSGGKDYGEVAVVETMVCQQCTQLVDVSVGGHGRTGKTGDPEIDAYLGKCPLCNGINVTTWDKSSCPRCQGRMNKGDLIELWD